MKITVTICEHSDQPVPEQVSGSQSCDCGKCVNTYVVDGVRRFSPHLTPAATN